MELPKGKDLSCKDLDSKPGGVLHFPLLAERLTYNDIIIIPEHKIQKVNEKNMATNITDQYTLWETNNHMIMDKYSYGAPIVRPEIQLHSISPFFNKD